MNSKKESSCAGKPIKAVMEMFSADLIAGCRKFAILANETKSMRSYILILHVYSLLLAPLRQR